MRPWLGIGLCVLMAAGDAQVVQDVKVGGLAPLVLRRKATGEGKKMEFTSVTLLPGRGMNVFQIIGVVPGRGETELLRSPAVAVAAEKLNGQGDDAYGNLNHSFGAAFLIPFSSRIGGELSADKQTVTATWKGKPIVLPNDFLGHYAVHGLINELKAEDVKVMDIAGGQVATAVIHAGNFGGHWLSSTDVHFKATLTADVVDVEATPVNVGKEPEPMAVGWHPYLAIVSGDRSQVKVHIPAAMVSRLDKSDGRPTGDLDPVKGTTLDFSGTDGAGLPAESVSVNLSHLTRTKGVVEAWLEDPKANYGIRVRGISPQINTVHLYSPKDGTFAAIEEQFNYMDALGTQWKGMDTGMVTLEPGRSTTWHVRLEMFVPTAE
jgi:aldose 1-epimerase